jgi:hypothetical protein
VSRLLLSLVACSSAVLLGGCAVASQPIELAGGPAPVKLTTRPAGVHGEQGTQAVVESPDADSIALESENGLDRYWTAGPVLTATLTRDFGDSTATPTPEAVRWRGHLLDRLQRPAKIAVCRAGSCREFYHEFPQLLMEENRRTVALTAGVSTAFARRSITGGDRTVLFKEALNSTVWSFQAEMAGRRWNARAQGFLGQDERGASLDLSRVIKPSAEGLSYGVAMHLGMTHDDWLPQDSGPIPADRTVYQVTVGPSVMIKGISASSQVGVYTNGTETLQVLSTRIAVNGNLTAVRSPVTISAEKSFSFGSGAVISRRRDAVERLTAGVYVLDNFAVNLGLTNHRSAWPNHQPSDDLQGSESLITLGGQYSFSW